MINGQLRKIWDIFSIFLNLIVLFYLCIKLALSVRLTVHPLRESGVEVEVELEFGIKI